VKNSLQKTQLPLRIIDMFVRGNKRRLAPLYMMSEGEGGGGSSDGGESKTFTAEEVEARIASEVDGLKNKNNELLSTVNDMKERLGAWGDLDPKNVRSMMEKMDKDEELRLMAEGKHDEAFQKRLEKVSAKHQSEVEGLSNQANQYKTDLEKAQSQIRDLIIDQQVTTGFISEKGLESAVPDVVLRAKTAFKIEDGQPIARDSDGEIIRGKDGPITINEWIQSLKESAPHLFPSSQGAGALGSGSGSRDSYESRMADAAASGNMEEYRRLRAERDKKAG
jgi:hypothetical protein